MQMQKYPLIYYKLIVYTKYMVKGISRGLLVWMALFCSLLLPLTAAWGMKMEVRAYQLETISCGALGHCDMPNCHCDCCQQTSSHLNGCRCSSFLTYLSPSRTILYDAQATPHRLEQITPVFKALGADIFHPPKSVSSLV